MGNVLGLTLLIFGDPRPDGLPGEHSREETCYGRDGLEHRQRRAGHVGCGRYYLCPSRARAGLPERPARHPVHSHRHLRQSTGGSSSSSSSYPMRLASSSSVSPSGAPECYARGPPSPWAFMLRSSPASSSRNRPWLLSLERCFSSLEARSSPLTSFGDLRPEDTVDLAGRERHRSGHHRGDPGHRAPMLSAASKRSYERTPDRLRHIRAGRDLARIVFAREGE